MISSSTDKRETRKFGALALIFFGALCATGLWRQKEILSALFGTLAFLGLCLLLFPGPMAPLHRGWLRAARFIGRVFTVLMLSAAYYLVITPVALAMRIFRGPPLPLSPDRTASSYWVPRAEPAQPKERFIKRY